MPPNLNDECERLVLGTVQLGLAYGVANRTGRPSAVEAQAVVQTAWEGGVRWFDTAQTYGDSEAVLGRALRALGASGEARVVSKLAPAAETGGAEGVIASVRASLARLGVPRLQGLLLHHEERLDDWEASGLVAGLDRVRHEGLAACVGVSVYSPARAEQALHHPLVAMLQLPANAADRRFERAGILARARDARAEVFVRSVFLQGLLLMDPDRLPPAMGFARPAVAAFAALCRVHGIAPAAAALAFVRHTYPGTRVLFGAERADQTAANLQAWRAPRPDAFLAALDAAEWRWDDRILNPAQWPRPDAAAPPVKGATP